MAYKFEVGLIIDQTNVRKDMNSQERSMRKKVSTMYRGVLSLFLIFVGAVFVVRSKEWIDEVEIFNQSHITLLILILAWITIAATAVLIEIAFHPNSIKNQYATFQKVNHCRIRVTFYGVLLWLVIILWVYNPFIIMEFSSQFMKVGLIKTIFVVGGYTLIMGTILFLGMIVQEEKMEILKYKHGHRLRMAVYIITGIFCAMNLNVAYQLHQQLSVYLQHIVVMIIIAGATTGIVKIFQWKA